MGSKRFPGKMAADLANFPIIEWVIRRVKRSKLLDEIVLATSVNSEDDYLENVANKFGVEVYRGNPEDVLSRFYNIAKQHGSDIIVRICGDNPFITASEIDKIIEAFQINKSDYSFNHIPALGNNYVDGLGAEVMSYETLEKIRLLANEKKHFEHVTKYIWENINFFNVSTIEAPSYFAFPQIRLDVNTTKDLHNLINYISYSYPNKIFPEEVDVQEIIETVLRENNRSKRQHTIT